MADVTQNDFRADFVGTVWVQFFCTNSQKPLFSIVMIKPAEQCRDRQTVLLSYIRFTLAVYHNLFHNKPAIYTGI